MVGGYQIIDFKSAKIRSDAQTRIPGIYDQIESALNVKPIMTSVVFLSNGTEVPPQFVKVGDEIEVTANSFVFTLSKSDDAVSITVTDQDMVQHTV